MSAGAVTWEPMGSPDLWDGEVCRAADHNVFQSVAWGEYRRRSGWQPRQWIARDRAGRTVMLIQMLTRSALGRVQVGWAPGGPIVGLGQARPRVVAGLQSLITTLSAEGPGYLRVNSLVPRTPVLDYALAQAFHRTLFRLNSGFTLRHDLERTSDVIYAQLSDHHRYDVQKALAADIRFEARTDDEGVRELVTLHDAMRAGKRDARVAELDGDELVAMRRALGGAAFVYTAYVADRPATSWLVSVYGGRAFLHVAASGPAGRDVGASYGLMYRLLLHLKSAGAKEFDLGAVNPRANQGGVNFFKLGFGGELTEYLGEWEWSNSRVLRVAMNVAARGRSDVS